jgi:hypothetical protein
MVNMQLNNNRNSEKDTTNSRKDYETDTGQEIQEQLDILCDQARSDINKAFNISLMKIEYLENLIRLYREMLEEENKWLAANNLTFKKIMEHCESAVDTTIPVDPEVIIEIVKGELR